MRITPNWACLWASPATFCTGRYAQPSVCSTSLRWLCSARVTTAGEPNPTWAALLIVEPGSATGTRSPTFRLGAPRLARWFDLRIEPANKVVFDGIEHALCLWWTWSRREFQATSPAGGKRRGLQDELRWTDPRRRSSRARRRPAATRSATPRWSFGATEGSNPNDQATQRVGCGFANETTYERRIVACSIAKEAA